MRASLLLLFAAGCAGPCAVLPETEYLGLCADHELAVDEDPSQVDRHVFSFVDATVVPDEERRMPVDDNGCIEREGFELEVQEPGGLHGYINVTRLHGDQEDAIDVDVAHDSTLAIAANFVAGNPDSGTVVVRDADGIVLVVDLIGGLTSHSVGGISAKAGDATSATSHGECADVTRHAVHLSADDEVDLDNGESSAIEVDGSEVTATNVLTETWTGVHCADAGGSSTTWWASRRE